MYTDISDHFPIFLIDNNGKLTNNLKYTTNRNFSQANIDTFYNNMQNLDWDIMTYTNNCQTAYSVFYKSLLREYNDCFPIKTIKLNYKNRKPWLIYGLKNSIKEKNRLYVKYVRQNTRYSETKYKVYKSKLNGLLRKSEREHYATLFEENKHNHKKSWSLLKEIINKKHELITQTKFIVNKVVTSDKKQISECFNKFYINVGSNLAKNIPQNQTDPMSYMKNSNTKTIYLEPVTENEVSAIVNSLKISSPEWDDISSKVIKKTYKSFIKPLTYLYNLYKYWNIPR